MSLPGRSAGWDDLLFDVAGIALGVMLVGGFGGVWRVGNAALAIERLLTGGEDSSAVR